MRQKAFKKEKTKKNYLCEYGLYGSNSQKKSKIECFQILK